MDTSIVGVLTAWVTLLSIVLAWRRPRKRIVIDLRVERVVV